MAHDEVVRTLAEPQLTASTERPAASRRPQTNSSVYCQHIRGGGTGGTIGRWRGKHLTDNDAKNRPRFTVPAAFHPNTSRLFVRRPQN